MSRTPSAVTAIALPKIDPVSNVTADMLEVLTVHMRVSGHTSNRLENHVHLTHLNPTLLQ
jgi:hypothetical protein